MPKIEFTVDSSLPPDAVLGAATNFTDRRPDLWPNISRKFYKVHEVGEQSAEATEGSDVFGGIWAREKYEWSTPGVVRGTVVESNIFHPGGIWQMTVEPRDGGSRITVLNHRQPKGFKGFVSRLMMSVVGKSFLTKGLHKTLDIIEKERNPSQSASPV